MKLYVRFQETSTGGESESDEPYSERTPHYVTHTTQFISTKEMTGYDIMTFNSTDDFSSDDVAHVVRVTYSTGDTFGRSHGRVEYVNAFRDQGEALRVTALIKTDKYKSSPDEWGYVYIPWVGYFESLENVEILTMRLG